MLAIYKKEMRSYFTSIIGYLFLAFFLALLGLYHYLQNMYGGYANFGYALYRMRMFFILLVPMVTMRLMAEEKRQRTDQMLFTSPVSISGVVFAKYLAVLSMFAIVMIISCIYPFVMTKYGQVNLKQAYMEILIFFLLGAAYMAIGLFISALTESQAFAAVITFVVVLVTSISSGIGGIIPSDSKTGWLFFALLFLIFCLITYLIMNQATISFMIGILGEIVLVVLYFIKPGIFEGAVQNFFDCFYILGRFDNIVYGILDVSDLIYYISISGLFVFLTIQGVKKRRWS